MSYELLEEEPQEPPKKTTNSVQPMPRLWKSEPEPTEEDSRYAKKSRKNLESDSTDEKSEKKVLIEETPTLDTFDSRRRARLIVGTLISACLLLFGWTVYRAFLYDPVGMAASNPPPGPIVFPAGPENRAALDQEAAQFMFNRAHELAKNGRTDQAVAMLNEVVKVYKGTPTARDCKAALDRADKNLPLFSDSPLVANQKEIPKAAAAPRRGPPLSMPHPAPHRLAKVRPPRSWRPTLAR